MRCTRFTACVFAILSGMTTLAHAQGFGRSNASAFGSGFGSSGFGSSSFGSGGFGGSGFGSSSFGSGFGGSGFGANSFGTSGFGSGGFGGSSFGRGGLGNSSFGTGGLGNTGFGGYGGGQNFVGRDSADMANVWNQMGQAGTRFFNQMNRGMSRNNNRESSSAQAGENVPQPMRVALKVAFTAPSPSSAELTNNIRRRIGRVLAVQNIAAPQISMEGDVAVLVGVAASESQRLVLEKLVAMEPGVREVRNEMTVVPPTALEQLPASGN
ncbi:MAG: BON domain-containing protein [Planctomycetes bacterium]|nr:BON domain-containing protein [Planctomycetota bacterium]